MGSISNLSAQYWNLSTSFSKFSLGTKCPGVHNTFSWNSLPMSINSSFNDEVDILKGGSGLSLHIQANIFHNPATNPVTPQTSLNRSKLMNKDRLAGIGKLEKTDRNLDCFLKKWKTHCIQLFSDNNQFTLC